MDRLRQVRQKLNSLGSSGFANRQAILVDVLSVMLTELEKLWDAQEPPRHSPEDFDWSQAKPGMAFERKRGEERGVVYYLCKDPSSGGFVVTCEEKTKLHDSEIDPDVSEFTPKSFLYRAPEYDVDWSHIHE